MTALAVLGGIALLLLAPLAVTAVRQRLLLAMAVRNVARRRSEAALIVGGALLGTAIITSAFVVGDVVAGSMRDAARTRLGPVDVTVTTPAGDAGDQLGDLASEIQAADVGNIDGMLTTTTAEVTLEAPAGPVAIPRATVAEFDLAAARSFGSDPEITGLQDVEGLDPGEVLLNTRSAEELSVGVGDRVRLHAYGGQRELTVAEVVPEVGLAGYGSAVVAPGTLDELAAAATSTAAPPRDRLLVSLTGGVFDTHHLGDPAAEGIAVAVREHPGTEVEAIKAALLDEAERNGTAYQELFTGIGLFSVLAGVLLLTNLFVMLAEERTSELGMLRALGLTRRRLTRAFAIEGAIYAVAAAAIGAVVGVGVGWVVAFAASSSGLVDGEGAFRLVVEPASVGLGATTGLIVSLVAIWITSQRIARFNIIRAIRDLSAVRETRTSARTLVIGTLGVVVGATVSVAGYLDEQTVPFVIGVPIAAFSATPLLRRLLPDRTARLLPAASVLAWGLAVSPLFPELMAYSEVSVFVVQVLVVTTGAVATSSSLGRVWAFVVDRWARGGWGLALRLGVVYPLARRVRTSMLLAMFTLVVLTITLISAMSVTFERNTERMVDQVAAGYDVVLDTSSANPVAAETLLEHDDVDDVARLTRGAVTVDSEHLEVSRSRVVSGFDADLLAFEAPGLLERDDAYATDADAHRAVLEDPSLAIVPEGLLDAGGADSTVTPISVGDTLTLSTAAGDVSRTVTIVGVRDLDWAGNGVMVNREVVEALVGDAAVASRSYVAAAEAVAADGLAAGLNAELLAHGADATSFGSLAADATAADQRAMSLVRAFLGLGLLIGIAGMGVVMVRTVRERRQAIGMLRAMGLRSGLVRAALLWEASFVAVQGTLIGAVFGLVYARQLLSTGAAFADAGVVFHVPWGALVVIVAVPLAAVLAATAWPASRAAAIRPAIALRTAD